MIFGVVENCGDAFTLISIVNDDSREKA